MVPQLERISHHVQQVSQLSRTIPSLVQLLSDLDAAIQHFSSEHGLCDEISEEIPLLQSLQRKKHEVIPLCSESQLKSLQLRFQQLFKIFCCSPCARAVRPDHLIDMFE